MLEEEAIRRACRGVNEPVFYRGKVCGAIQKYSDTLLIVLLKALAPAKYREVHELQGEGGGPVILKVIYDDKPPKRDPGKTTVN